MRIQLAHTAAVAGLLILVAPSIAQSAPTYHSQHGAITAELAVAPSQTSMTYTVRGPTGTPSLVEQAKLLRELLPQALAKGRPRRLYFIPAANQPLVDQLANTLSHDPGWNPRTGEPRRGRLGSYLTAMIARSALARPYADAFAAAGYRLTPVTASRVVIGRHARTGPVLVPVTISELGFDAVRS